MADSEDLEKRLSKLENVSGGKFFVQYLLSPLLIICIGTFVNWRIEQGRSETQRIDLAQKMVTSLFSGNPDQAFALERLMARIVDKDLADEIRVTVGKYYQARVKDSLKQGNVEAAAQIVSAAEQIGGSAAETVAQSVKPDQRAQIDGFRSRVDVAQSREREGFQKLLSGDVDGAISAFDAAEAAYPGFHDASELAQLIRQKKADLADPVRQKEIFRTITSRYAWHAPQDLVGQLRARAQ
jgi:hypothetical protein